MEKVQATLSISGNAAVLINAARRLTLLKAPELLTVNLAITDIGMALSMYPLSIASAFNHAWIGGIKFQRRTISIVISGIWLYSCLWAVFPLLGWGSYGPEPFGLACSIDWTGYGESLNHSTFIMALSVLCTFLPCLVILFSYFGIAWKLHRAYQSIQSNDIQYGNVEKKVTLIAVMISSGFLIAWTPYVAVSFWSMFHSKEQDHMAPFITLLPCLFAKSSTVYNPFIYFIFQRTFWDKLLCLQRLLQCCSHQADSSVEGRKVEDKMVRSSDLIEAPVQSV
ncbi:Opsin-5 G-protein coupled receptor 136 [Larimichthys crocea]|uniref:Opsin-5 G-protein coupled receptor 136 n=1 Tax=Larimichthys crocea TaxID=215358 RepID=A0A6G0I6E2_LARCR|nr:Opsin-5 G-protein coupled receptor 136 [Larimichthys crocea]